MKKHFLPVIILVVFVFVIAGCKKESTSLITRNTPPKANAGSDIQVNLPANSCVLAGSAQDDENNIDVILWKKVSGPASFYIENPGLLSTSVKDLVLGVYQFELTVKDKGGLSAKDTVVVNVNSTIIVNQPPVAKAGLDQLIHLPLNSINLDGSGSSDPDNNISSYQWTKISGPSSFTIATPTAVQTVVTGLVIGTYKFELQVTDAGNLSSKDTLEVIVNPPLAVNQPPVANAGPDKSITLPINNITLDGSGSNDPDNNISSYQWTKISGPSSFTVVTPTAVQTTVSNLVVGIYKFELKVTDNGGLTDKDTIQVIVNPVVTVNQPPVSNAGPDRTINLPVNNTTLDGSGSSDPENNISSFQWAKIAGPSAITIQTPAAAQTTVTNLVAGFYEFELKVTDAGGLWSKDTVKVTVYGNTQEVVFNNLPWIPIWYQTLEINDIYSFIPATTPFRVYIQRDFNPAWIEATPVAPNGTGGDYEYFVETRPGGGGMYTYGSLYVFGYGTNLTDTPNVKIVF
jgi:hypothetical protein